MRVCAYNPIDGSPTFIAPSTNRYKCGIEGISTWKFLQKARLYFQLWWESPVNSRIYLGLLLPGVHGVPPFVSGKLILTEFAYKYELDGIAAMVVKAGYRGSKAAKEVLVYTLSISIIRGHTG